MKICTAGEFDAVSINVVSKDDSYSKRLAEVLLIKV